MLGLLVYTGVLLEVRACSFIATEPQMSQRDNCTLKILLVEEIMLARRNLAKINGGNSFNEGSKMGK